MLPTGGGNVSCSIKRSTTCSKMLLLVRLCCQWSVLRRPSATCADVCGIETAYRSGFCVLLHLFKSVMGFTLCLIAVIKRCAPLAVSMSIFPPCRELLRRTSPELKHIFVRLCLETGHHQIHCKLPKASHRFLNIDQILQSGDSNTMAGNPSDMELSPEGPCFR